MIKLHAPWTRTETVNGMVMVHIHASDDDGEDYDIALSPENTRWLVDSLTFKLNQMTAQEQLRRRTTKH